MRLFISYAHDDKEKVHRLVELLKRGGHNTWFDVQLRAGDDWKLKLGDVIHDCEAFLYALTPAAIASEWCQWEFATAIAAGKPIIPILLEKSELPPELSKFQYADLSSGLTGQAVAKLLGDLHSWEVIIPPEEATPAPNNPKGVPASAAQPIFITELKGGTGNTVNTVGGDQHITINTAEKERNWNSSVIIGLVIGLFSLIATVVALLPQVQKDNILYSVGLIAPSATSTLTPTNTPTPTPTSTPTAPRMAAGGFNVVVAGFGMVQPDGSVAQGTLADDLSDIVYDSIRELAQIDNLLGRNSPGVGHILGENTAKREQQAAEMAAMLNASIIIYGVVRSDGNLFNVFEPEFYIDADLAAVEPELVGADRLGDPVEFVGNTGDTVAAAVPLQNRIEVLRYFVRGLSQYIAGNFEQARTSYEQALEVEPELEVLNVFAGNAAVRQMDTLAAFEFYNEALRTRPEYARGLVGRGIALFQMARETAPLPPFDPALVLDTKFKCHNVDRLLPDTPQLLAELALRCYQEGGQSQDTLPTSDIDVKSAFGVGQVNVWLSQNYYGDHWSEARDALQMVIDLYNESPPDRQLRIRTHAAHAHAWLGLRLLTIDGSNLDSVKQALEYYKTAQGLLRLDDANRVYNQKWIDLYGEQIIELEDFLADQDSGAVPVQSVSTPTPEATLTPTLETVG